MRTYAVPSGHICSVPRPDGDPGAISPRISVSTKVPSFNVPMFLECHELDTLGPTQKTRKPGARRRSAPSHACQQRSTHQPAIRPLLVRCNDDFVHKGAQGALIHLNVESDSSKLPIESADRMRDWGPHCTEVPGADASPPEPEIAGQRIEMRQGVGTYEEKDIHLPPMHGQPLYHSFPAGAYHPLSTPVQQVNKSIWGRLAGSFPSAALRLRGQSRRRGRGGIREAVLRLDHV